MQRKYKPQTTVKEWLKEGWEDAKAYRQEKLVKDNKPQRNLWNSMEQGRAELANAFGQAWPEQIAVGIESTSPKLQVPETEMEPKPEAPEKNHNDRYFSPSP